MPGFAADGSLLDSWSSARKSLGGRKGLSSSSTEPVLEAARPVGVTAPDVDASCLVEFSILPPRVPDPGVQERFAKWPPRVLAPPGGGPTTRGAALPYWLLGAGGGGPDLYCWGCGDAAGYDDCGGYAEAGG